MKNLPWKAGHSGVLRNWPEVRDAKGELLARFYGPDAETLSQLFAAAPRMLQALRSMMEHDEALDAKELVADGDDFNEVLGWAHGFFAAHPELRRKP